ncbi:MAG: hypothetical protein ACI8QD_001166 [Cyclobacteriaceae bacterium]|jgi:hypothetical protein
MGAFARQDVEVFSKGGREGLKDLTGTTLIPAVFDKLGWSDGKFQIFGDIIGYKEGSKWGLVSLKNKLITPPTYYSLSILDSSYLLAAIKGKFSNHLFNGLINLQGKVVLSCNYFDILPLPSHFIVSQYDKGSVRQGLLTADFDQLMPIVYQQIRAVNETIFAGQIDAGRWHLAADTGTRLASAIDGYELVPEGVLVTASGKVGIRSIDDLSELHPTTFKMYQPGQGLTSFPKWEVMTLSTDSVFAFEGDSLGHQANFFITHVNGNQEVLIAGKKLYGQQSVVLKQATDGYLIAQDLLTRSWQLNTTSGRLVIGRQDSIAFDGMYFFCKDKEGWQVYNRFGRKLSPKRFEEVKPSVSYHVPVARNNSWSLIDFQGKMISPFRYDGVLGGQGNKIIVDYLGSIGVINTFGDWVLAPKYTNVLLTDELMIASINTSHNIYLAKGGFVRTVVAETLNPQDKLIAYKTNSGWGMMSLTGALVGDPIYDSVFVVGDFYVGKGAGYVSLFNEQGKQIASAAEGIETIAEGGEGLYRIVKNQRVGYLDSGARLIIANRYDNGGVYAEERIPIKIGGKWGYVDILERIVIQPQFDSAGSFENGVAIVSKDGSFGMIDTDGQVLLETKYRVISHEQGGAYIFSLDGILWGATDQSGSISLAPNYLEIIETSNKLLIVNRDGKWGILSAEGYTKVPFGYDEIIQLDDYLLLKTLPN